MAEDWRDYIVEQEIVMRPLKDLIPYDRNAKLHENMVAYLRNNIRKIKFRNPIYIDQDMVIIEGHARRLAAMEIGMEMVPTIMVTDLTPEEVKLMRLADNRLAELSDYDLDMLGLEISELKADTGWDLTEFGLNFDFDDIPDIEDFDDDLDEPDDMADIMPDIPDEPFIQEGDVIHMGPHILVCGDYRDEDMRELLPKAKADMAIANPTYMNPTDDDFLTPLLKACHEAFVIAPNQTKAAYAVMHSKVLANLKDIIYWRISNPVAAEASSVTHTMHPILCLDKSGSLKYRHKSDISYDVIEASCPDTGLPVSLTSELIRTYTEEGDTVLDCFSCNGAALISCCDLGRTCVMMEPAPLLCDIIIRRYAEHTGERDVKVVRGNTVEGYPLPD